MGNAEILKLEYERLKEEQVRRIGFRDNLIYVALVVSGSVFGFFVSGASRGYVLLIVPFALSILGWTYFVNDEKISSIGRYIREDLSAELTGGLTEGSTLGWETFHRSDDARVWRKRTQTAVDIATFCVPSLVALGVFFSENSPFALRWVIGPLETVVVILLALVFWRFADDAREPVG